jgi:hypothetical protein
MQGHIDTVNFRTGTHRHFYGEVWKLNDGPEFLGWQTVVPIHKGDTLIPMVSKVMNKDMATTAAEIVKAAETWEQARASIEAAFPLGFPGMTYRS